MTLLLPSNAAAAGLPEDLELPVRPLCKYPLYSAVQCCAGCLSRARRLLACGAALTHPRGSPPPRPTCPLPRFFLATLPFSSPQFMLDTVLQAMPALGPELKNRVRRAQGGGASRGRRWGAGAGGQRRAAAGAAGFEGGCRGSRPACRSSHPARACSCTQSLDTTLLQTHRMNAPVPLPQLVSAVLYHHHHIPVSIQHTFCLWPPPHLMRSSCPPCCTTLYQRPPWTPPAWPPSRTCPPRWRAPRCWCAEDGNFYRGCRCSVVMMPAFESSSRCSCLCRRRPAAAGAPPLSSHHLDPLPPWPFAALPCPGHRQRPGGQPGRHHGRQRAQRARRGRPLAHRARRLRHRGLRDRPGEASCVTHFIAVWWTKWSIRERAAAAHGPRPHLHATPTRKTFALPPPACDQVLLPAGKLYEVPKTSVKAARLFLASAGAPAPAPAAQPRKQD